MTPNNTPTSEERAKEIVDVFLKRPDWIDTGHDDCFICGTPLREENYNKRSQYIVDAIAAAIDAQRKEVARECAEIASEYTMNQKVGEYILWKLEAIKEKFDV